MLNEKLSDLKTQNFKQRAAEQREKINKLKVTDDLIEEAQAVVEEQERPTERVPTPKPAKAKKAAPAKPAWATTEKQQEE